METQPDMIKIHVEILCKYDVELDESLLGTLLDILKNTNPIRYKSGVHVLQDDTHLMTLHRDAVVGEIPKVTFAVVGAIPKVTFKEIY